MRKGLLLATAAGFVALVGSGSVNAADKIKIGVTATLEGTYTVLGEDGIEHGVGNGITNFVGMALADGFGRKDAVFIHVLLWLMRHIDIS